MKIRNRNTGEVIFSSEHKTMREVVEEAVRQGADLEGADLRGAKLSYTDLSDADLEGANLTGANLTGANLSGADLNSTIGNMKEIKSLQLDAYQITFTSEVLQIGCHGHPIEDWFKMSDVEIDEMDSGALEWWDESKEFIKMVIKKYNKGIEYDL